MKLQPALFLVFAVVGLKTAIAFSVESEDLNESDGNSKRDEMDFDEQSTEDDHGMEDFDLDSEENTERDSDEESQRENMSEDDAEDLNSEEKAQRENLEADELGGLDALLENLENVADQQDSKETIQ
ncbi:probable DNA-directed RNA polymerase subunit delta isoform X3 [Acipenser ruthenus]|uniref:probable DNA-directed RNA polymerase subunit delta isoform X3 n=1 Tax=Acipenser ruthenus TaxID=7906 RepID=UPI00145B3D08|nr:probable DNA-directed RNA polymerase subunit delta isoform X3 [Acipenser ruthenus]